MLARDSARTDSCYGPLASALAVGRPGPSSVALAPAAAGLVRAQEPRLVLLNNRGLPAARNGIALGRAALSSVNLNSELVLRNQSRLFWSHEDA